MTINVKVVDRPIAETSYVRATLQGLGNTFRHLIDPHKVTTQYPEERESISPRWRGTHRMLTTEDGKAKCVACGLCPTVCPANCIKLVPGEDEQGNRYPLVFEIDEFRCIFCGLCQEVCPEEAIWLQTQYSMTGYTREEMVNHKDRLYELGGTLPDAHLKWDKKKAAEDAAAHGGHH